MTVSELLGELRDTLNDVRRMKDTIHTIQKSCSTGNAQIGAPRRAGTPSGGDSRLDSIVSLSLKLEALERYRAQRLRLARAILYGGEYGGGLANVRSGGDVDAAIIEAYYLAGYRTWDDVGAELAWSGSRAPGMWAKMRARRAIAYMDSIGPWAMLGLCDGDG